MDFLKKQFSEEQIDIPFKAIALGLNPILGRYLKFYSFDDCREATDGLIERNMFKVPGEELEGPEDNHYKYNEVRIFIHKEEEKIKELLAEDWNHPAIEMPPQERTAEYLEALSGLAKHYLTSCLERFVKDIDRVEEEEKLKAQKENEHAAATEDLSTSKEKRN